MFRLLIIDKTGKRTLAEVGSLTIARETRKGLLSQGYVACRITYIGSDINVSSLC